jgi:hypothetical protein
VWKVEVVQPKLLDLLLTQEVIGIEMASEPNLVVLNVDGGGAR